MNESDICVSYDTELVFNVKDIILCGSRVQRKFINEERKHVLESGQLIPNRL